MSLQVWLPLTKDLRQQGLSNVIVTNNGATFNSAGKLGGCYYFNGSSTIIFPSYDTTRSIAFWIKSPKTNSTIAFVDYKSKLGFGFQSNGYIIPNCADSSLKMYVANNFIANEWNHIVVTRDDNFTDVTLYINGALQTSRTSGNNNWTNNVDNCYIGGRSTGTNMTCYINDFRVYDHTLSPMEIKELSKGLVLHYPLNREGWGQENLIAGTDFNGSSKKYTVTSGTEGGFTYTPTETILANTEYTVSCQLRGNANMNLYKLCTGGNEAINWVNRSQLSTTEYRPFSITFTYPSSKTLNQIYICTRYGTSNTSTGDWFEIKPNSLKLEKGSIVTPWCPNSSDALATTMGLNETTEYDCSGFCNNGIRTGTFSWTSDTPKYSVSQIFNGTDNVITLPSISDLLQDVFTMNIWFRKDELGSKNYETLFGGPSGFEMDTRANDASVLTLYMALTRGGNVYTGFQFGEWYMVTLVNDGTNELYYINGELVNTITKRAMPTGTYYIGSWQTINKQNYKGFLSDARIYTTALSADDIKSLYQNCATIDPDGTIRGQIRN